MPKIPFKTIEVFKAAPYPYTAPDSLGLFCLWSRASFILKPDDLALKPLVHLVNPHKFMEIQTI